MHLEKGQDCIQFNIYIYIFVDPFRLYHRIAETAIAAEKY